MAAVTYGIQRKENIRRLIINKRNQKTQVTIHGKKKKGFVCAIRRLRSDVET